MYPILKNDYFTLNLTFNFYLLFFFCFNPNVRQAGQRQLLFGNLSAMFEMSLPYVQDNLMIKLNEQSLVIGC